MVLFSKSLADQGFSKVSCDKTVLLSNENRINRKQFNSLFRNVIRLICVQEVLVGHGLPFQGSYSPPLFKNRFFRAFLDLVKSGTLGTEDFLI